MGVRPPPEATLPVSQRDLLESFATQIALALDRERLRASEEAARLSQESEKLHRTLLDGVSHELKTPLAVIAAATENLADGPLVAEIRTAAQRLQRLVNNLLDMTRLESGKLRLRRDWCDPADLINAAREETADAWRGRTVRMELPAGLPLVRADAGLIQQALANLIHNACVHTPPTAAITLAAGADESARQVWIRVADNGPGLRPEQRDRLFDKFFRGEPGRAGGLGLGLSIARGFVEAHGGRIAAENQAGGGARFTIFLPWERPATVPSE
jgi:two-component system sensor histidine kinase KdpD